MRKHLLTVALLALMAIGCGFAGGVAENFIVIQKLRVHNMQITGDSWDETKNLSSHLHVTSIAGQRAEISVGCKQLDDPNACGEVTVCMNPECSHAITIAARTDLNAYVIQALAPDGEKAWPIEFWSRNIVFHTPYGLQVDGDVNVGGRLFVRSVEFNPPGSH
jgi:hypothetical protein